MEQKELEYYLSQVRRIAEHREKGAMLKIRKTFKALLRDLKHFVADEYADLAENDELTFEILNRKRQYARFIEEAVAVVDKYYPDALKQTTDVVEQTYQLVYDGMIDSVEKCSTSAELDEAFKGVKAATPQQIRAAVMNPITKITVPDTYAKDRANYIYDLKRELNTGLLNGDRYSTMAKRIVDRTKIAYRRAECVVRTETHRVREQGFCDSAVEINQTLEQGETSMRMVKTWCTMEDERVRGGKKGQKANHRKMNGVSVPIDEKFDLGRGIKTMCPGSSGDAANDINCRCFLVHELKDMTGKLKAKPDSEKVKTSKNVGNQLPNEEESSIIKTRQLAQEKPFNYNDYEELNDKESVDSFIKYVSEVMKIEHINGIEKLKNGIDSSKIVKTVYELSNKYGAKFTRLTLADFGSERTAAETHGKELRLNINYLNRPEAFKALLNLWLKDNYIPKSCNNVEYVARHEYFHLLTQDKIDEPKSKIKVLVNRYFNEGGESISKNGEKNYHEFVSDLLSSKSLNKLQVTLKNNILKLYK